MLSRTTMPLRARLIEILRREVATQARRVSTWLGFVALLAFAILVTRGAYVGEARAEGYVLNAPFVVAAVTVLGSLIGLMVAAGIAGDAAARDVRDRTRPLLFTTPVTKDEYLGGRFLAAFGLYAAVSLAPLLGVLLASVTATGLEPGLLGPLRPAAYLTSYLFLALPTGFVVTALLFALAVVGGRSVVAYGGALLLFIGSILSWQLLALRLGHWDAAKLLDPLGLVVLSELSRTWAPAQKSTLLMGLEGSLLWNRLLWLTVAVGVLGLTRARFRLALAEGRSRGRRHGRRGDSLGPGPGSGGGSGLGGWAPPLELPRVRPAFPRVTALWQVLSVARGSFREVVTGWGALVLVALPVLLFLTGPELLEVMGVPLTPRTEHVVSMIGGGADLVWLAIPLLIVFYAGELTWRERDARVSQLTDAAPVRTWVPFVGKLLGLVLALLTLQALLMMAAVLLQARLGYHEVEPWLYVRTLLGLQLADHVLFAVLALALHALVDRKHVGNMLGVAAYGVMAFAPALGVRHNLLVYGADPGWTYTDMVGFWPSLGPWLWFNAYWASWGLLLGVVAVAAWVRGTGVGLRERVRRARRRFGGPLLGAGVAAVALVMATGGFVFYNTNLLHEHSTPDEAAARRAEYERLYGRYDDIAQPRLTGTSLRVELYPRERRARVEGTYHAVNRTGSAIDSIHIATASDVETRGLRFDRPASPVLVDDRLGHRIYRLDEPLRPGDTLGIRFEVVYHPRGFRNDGVDASVVENGTYVTGRDWLPAIGYQSSREIWNPGERRAQGLPARPREVPLEDVRARYDMAGAEQIAFEAVVGTEPDQVAVAPGVLRRSWAEGGRRYFEYATNAPIRNDFAIYSAAYGVHEGQWNDVGIRIVHHPSHDRNLEGMVRGVRAALDYLTRTLGPYPYDRVRLVEHPGHGNTLHAAPINISYQEGFSLLDPDADRRDIDFPFAIMAHEVAHQWWGNQLAPALVEGAPLLTESLAWYTALRVVEEQYGTEHLERLLSLLRHDLQVPRARAAPPLLRAAGQFAAHRKGPLALYALGEYAGHDRVEAALRRVMQTFGSGEPPLATSLDLYRELGAALPDSLDGLLHDLFETNTFWELETEEVRARPLSDGRWRVTLDVRARKVVVDSAGQETELPMNDLVEVGVYSRAGDGAGSESAPALYLGRHLIRSGRQQITVTVSGAPGSAGVDPRALLVDLEPSDNVAAVSEGGGALGDAPHDGEGAATGSGDGASSTRAP